LSQLTICRDYLRKWRNDGKIAGHWKSE